MRKKLFKNNIVTLLLFVCILATVITMQLYAQNYYDDVICVPTSKQPYYFVNQYYYPYTISNGTIIDRPSLKVGKTEKKNTAESDSAESKNKIEVKQEATSYYCTVELKDYNQTIQISAYNLLGKRVIDIYRGTARKDFRYDIDVSSLPNGLYICVVQGANLRMTEKFIVSR